MADVEARVVASAIIRPHQGDGGAPVKRKRSSSRASSHSPSPGNSHTRRRRSRSPRPRSSFYDVDPERRRERERQLAMRAEQPSEPKKPLDLVEEQKVMIDTTRTGGAYIPPHRLRAMQQQLTDKSSKEYQRITWEALKKSINGLINKVNTANIKQIIPDLFGENLIRGRGLFCRSIMKAQAASLPFTPVYAALVAVVNTKFPMIGELLLNRLIMQFRRAFKRNDKTTCLAVSSFIAHLSNQFVASEIVPLQILLLLLERPTDDSVEIAVGFIREVGAHLTEVEPKYTNAIFERFRAILHEGQIDKRVQYMIEVLFQVRKDKFSNNPPLIPDLDLVEEEDQITHRDITLDSEDLETADDLNIFKYDPDYLTHEEEYAKAKKEILGDDDEEDEGDESEEESEEDEVDAVQQRIDIQDETNADIVGLRRSIYLTIMSSVDFEECVHKLLKLDIREGQEIELANMVIECCSQERTYLKFYGLMGERFCRLNRIWAEAFEECFRRNYETIHRFETNRLRNIGRFFGHLMSTDSVGWTVFSVVRLTEEDTTSASRIFLKILFQEILENLGLKELSNRLKDHTMADSYAGLFPKDNPKNTRFAINYFTSIGLGAVTDDLREWLRTAPKMVIQSQSQSQTLTPSLTLVQGLIHLDRDRGHRRVVRAGGRLPIRGHVHHRVDQADGRRHIQDRCPWAYIASRRIEAIAKRTSAKLQWEPVLLGGIYEATKAPQGKAGSATDVMPANKKAITAKDLGVTTSRYNIPFNYHPRHPVRTVEAVRLLHATPQSHRAALTHAFYKLYWVENTDISDRTVLLRKTRELNIPFEQDLNESIFDQTVYKDALQKATTTVVEKGAPGVPFFTVSSPKGEVTFWGQDRLHFVEASLSALSSRHDALDWDKVANIDSLYPRLTREIQAPRKTLTFYYDFSSPWTYLAWTQMERLRQEATLKGQEVFIEYVPVLVGALFREIGTPMLPMETMSDARRAYQSKDLQDWPRFWRTVMKQSPARDLNKDVPAGDIDGHMQINWPTKFPIRSVLPLRVALLEQAVIGPIFKAAWVDDVDISDATRLEQILNFSGFRGKELIEAAQADKNGVKSRLMANNKRAVQNGACGVPTFQVDGQDVIWGQDRLNVVADELCRASVAEPCAKL